VDEGDFFEIGVLLPRTSWWASRGSRAHTGIVANQPMVLAGVLGLDASRKAARFVRFYDCFQHSARHLRRWRGLSRHRSEYGGLIKHGAKLLFAFTGPRCRVTVIAQQYGGALRRHELKAYQGDVTMPGRRPRSQVMYRRQGAVEILYRAELGATRKDQERIDEYQKRFANPFVAAERGYIDEVIMPHGTRKRVARALQMLRNKRLTNPWKKHDNIPL
jgi:propionyl-CoA carboxylase beta chain